MSIEPMNAGIRCTSDLMFQCEDCGAENIIEASYIYSEAWQDNAPMGIRIEYEFFAECHCWQCQNVIEFRQRASEYPEGCIEYESRPDCFGGALLTKPELCIDFDDEIYFSDISGFVPPQSEELYTLSGKDRLFVDIVDGNGYVGNQYIHARKIILNPAQRLLPILVEETGTIRFDENRAVLAELIRTDPNISTMRLMGKVAEAVIVRNCRDDGGTNRLWLSIARKIKITRKIADGFRAIGTGLNSTKIFYPRKYSPSDPQRDIEWINADGNLALMSGSYSSALPAGLQIKVSGNGLNYIYNDLRRQRYEVPLVYFPVNDDYDQIFDKLIRNGQMEVNALRNNFVNVREVDENAFYELRDYYPLLRALIAGQVSADQFVREASGIVPVQNSIMASVFARPQAEVRIIH